MTYSFSSSPVPGDRFPDDELQKPLEPVALLKRRAGEDPLELLADWVADVRFVAGGRRPFGHPAYLNALQKFSSSLMPSGSWTKICTVLSRGTTASRNGIPAARSACRVPSRSTPRNAT